VVRALRQYQFTFDGAGETRMAREPEDVVNAVVFALIHKVFTNKAAVGSQDDAQVGPALADLRHDARDLLFGAVGRILVGASELGRE
jgi:hypothetical protein